MINSLSVRFYVRLLSTRNSTILSSQIYQFRNKLTERIEDQQPTRFISLVNQPNLVSGQNEVVDEELLGTC